MIPIFDHGLLFAGRCLADCRVGAAGFHPPAVSLLGPRGIGGGVRCRGRSPSAAGATGPPEGLGLGRSVSTFGGRRAPQQPAVHPFGSAGQPAHLREWLAPAAPRRRVDPTADRSLSQLDIVVSDGLIHDALLTLLSPIATWIVPGPRTVGTGFLAVRIPRGGSASVGVGLMNARPERERGRRGRGVAAVWRGARGPGHLGLGRTERLDVRPLVPGTVGRGHPRSAGGAGHCRRRGGGRCGLGHVERTASRNGPRGSARSAADGADLCGER